MSFVRSLLLISMVAGTALLLGMGGSKKDNAAAGGGAAASENAAAEVKAAMLKMNAAWDKRDVVAVRALLAPDIVTWDFDMMGKPAGWASADELVKFAETMFAEMKKMGGESSSTLKSLNCTASGDLGHCVQELNYNMTMPGAPPMTMPLRATALWKKTASGWLATHYHGSLREAAPMPTKFMSLNSKNAQWMDVPGMDGLKMSPVWMNPFTQQSAGLVKALKTDDQALHMHPAAVTITVLEGTFTTTGADGKDKTFKAGDVIYRAANEPHRTKINKGAVVFMVTDGPLVQIPLDDQGKPKKTAMR